MAEYDKSPGDVDTTLMLANALKRMDGLIGSYSEVREEGGSSTGGGVETVGSRICRLSNELRAAIAEYECENTSARSGVDPRAILPQETTASIVHWLSAGQLQRQISELQRALHDRELELDQWRGPHAEEELVYLRSSLEQKEGELQRLRDAMDQLQSENEHKAMLIAELNHTPQPKSGLKLPVSPTSPPYPGGDGEGGRSPGEDGGFSRQSGERKSFRQRMTKAFSRTKKNRTLALEEKPMDADQANLFGRAQEFMILAELDLEEWLREQGLGQYIPSVLKHTRTGSQLASLSVQDLEEKLLMANPFHRKKLFLAIKDALSDVASPEGALDHVWVMNWLEEIGLPQYKPNFVANLMDGRMLNCLMLEELTAMDVCVPLHIISLRRAVQALRLHHFRPDFLRAPPSGEGSQQVVEWSAARLAQWLRSVDLAELVPSLKNQGIHGALLMLEVRFTEVTLMHLLGVGPQKSILRRHVTTKFQDLIGPITAQRKLDAFASKASPPLDPFEKAKKRQHKLRPKGLMDGTPLCPAHMVPSPARDASFSAVDQGSPAERSVSSSDTR